MIKVKRRISNIRLTNDNKQVVTSAEEVISLIFINKN